MDDEKAVEVMARGLFAASPQAQGWTWESCGNWQSHHIYHARIALAAIRAAGGEVVWKPHACSRCGQPNPDRVEMDGCRDPLCPEVKP